MIYFDTSYLARLYLPEPGSDEVGALDGTGEICCSIHGRMELISAFHWAFRDGRLKRSAFLGVLDQFLYDEEARSMAWLAAGSEIVHRGERVYRNAPATIFLRAADAMHLACAAENGLKEIYSNDRHLLTAAPLFGLKGKDVIPRQ